MATANARQTGKGFITNLVLALIVILMVASVLNIIHQSANYHHNGGLSAILIGIGFGVAFAVTVYVVMVAESGATRWTAIAFATVFGVVSGAIQTDFYQAAGAAPHVAIAYGYGVPGFEAALAILEALLRKEETATRQRTLADELAAKLDVALAEQATANGLAANLQQQVDELTANLADANRQLEAAKTADANPPAPSTKQRATLTAKQIANCQKVADVAAKSGGFATDAELADLAEWTETTARRYRSLAVEHGFIHRNGDERYHPKEGDHV